MDTDDEAVSAGMVFTIEPGAYFAGFGGVRIEDDVAVTGNGPDVLTGSLVKEPDAIEKLMAR